jgi:peroxiredoxin Q/BCP
MVNEGLLAPEFELYDQAGVSQRLSDFRGKWVLLYFYPKDDTPGCTKEACAIRDMLPDFSTLKAVVFGISADSVESHKKFAEKHTLNFSILADPDRVVINAYGVWGKKQSFGREVEGILRTSFLVNPEGIIKKVYKNVKPEEHAQQVITDLKHFQSQ